MDGAAKADGEPTPASKLTLRSGKNFPEFRSSTIDVNGNPVYDPIGKPITQVEIDADLAEQEKPWRRPGADQSDYFNYGFDEFTWSTYCLRQKSMGDKLTEQRAENAQFEMMFGNPMGGMQSSMPTMPTMPSAPSGGMGGMPGMGAIPGLPDQQQFQRMMMQAMEEQGISDPSQLDFNSFMARLQGGTGMMPQQQNVPSGPASQQQGYGQGGQWGGQQQGYGRGGKGRRW